MSTAWPPPSRDSPASRRRGSDSAARRGGEVVLTPVGEVRGKPRPIDLFETRTPYLLLAPSKILPLQLDELHQTFCWPLVDSQGTVLTLRWPCGDEHQRHSRILTHWSELPGRKCLLVACQETPRAMLQPVSLLQADGQHWRVRALQYSDEPKGLSLSHLPGRIARMLAERRAPPALARTSAGCSYPASMPISRA